MIKFGSKVKIKNKYYEDQIGTIMEVSDWQGDINYQVGLVATLQVPISNSQSEIYKEVHKIWFTSEDLEEI